MNQGSDIPAHATCFACGRLNENGLRLTFETVDRITRCRTILDSRYQSYDGIVHGGILASIADGAMVNLVHRQFGGRPVTCHLNIRYREPVHIGEEIVAEAEIIRSKCRIAWASCQITTNGRLCAKAEAEFKVESAQ